MQAVFASSELEGDDSRSTTTAGVTLLERPSASDFTLGSIWKMRSKREHRWKFPPVLSFFCILET
jgi:hypothetical protein